jgi:hypothetical protein
MALEGTVTNGMIVLDPPQVLPEGTRVEVVPKTAATRPNPKKTLQEVLLESAGTMTDLPADFAAQHDHYIHGTPKR